MTQQVIYPEGVGVQGNLSVKIVLGIADTSAPSLATEINAASSLDISCYLHAGGWNATVSPSKGNAPRRLCTREQLQAFGADTYDLADLVYTFSPQKADTDDANLAFAKLQKGLEVFAVERMGLDARTDAFEVGQYINIHPIRLGPQIETGDTTDEFDEFKITQPVIYTAPKIQRVQIAA